VVTINGTCSEFVPFIVIDNLLFRKKFHYNNEEFDDCVLSEKSGK